MFDSEEENCSLQSLVQKRKGKGGKKKDSNQKLKVKIKRKSPTKLDSNFETEKNENIHSPYGFERRLKAERILGAMKSSEGIMFLVKWKGINEADLVSSKDANLNCPELVIKYYEDNLYLKKDRIDGPQWIHHSFKS